MAERIIVVDPSLKEREEAAIADLKALADEENVIDGLDSRDKSLGKRLSKLYVRIGYESRRDMIEAFGFKLGASSKGGRPVGVNPVEYVEKLAELYPQGAPAASIGEFKEVLLAEHPELAPKLKTVQNASKSAFGSSFGKVLRERGIIGDRERKMPFDASRCIEMMDALKGANADGAEARAESRVGQIASQLDEIASIIAQRQADIVLEDRPKTIGALIDAYPEYGDVMKKAQNARVLTLDYALEKDLLAPRGAHRRERYSLAAARSIRNAQMYELMRIWEASELPRRIERTGRRSRLLAPSIVCIDLDAATQDEMVVRSKLRRVTKGDPLSQDAILREFGYGTNGTRCELVAEQEAEGFQLWQVVETRTEPLSADTLIFGLHKAGVLTLQDLGVADGWRVRFSSVLE